MKSLLILFFVALTSSARAETFERSYPAVPTDNAPAAGKRIATKVVDAGNRFLAQHVGTLTARLLSLQVDATQRNAAIGLGGGDPRFMKLRLAGKVTVEDGTARISSRLALGLGGRRLDIRLPNIDVAAASYRGERGVEVRLPLLRRAF